jgi:hypothetical protein
VLVSTDKLELVIFDSEEDGAALGLTDKVEIVIPDSLAEIEIAVLSGSIDKLVLVVSAPTDVLEASVVMALLSKAVDVLSSVDGVELGASVSAEETLLLLLITTTGEATDEDDELETRALKEMELRAAPLDKELLLPTS